MDYEVCLRIHSLRRRHKVSRSDANIVSSVAGDVLPGILLLCVTGVYRAIRVMMRVILTCENMKHVMAYIDVSGIGAIVKP